MDLETGDRSVVSDAATGTGPELVAPSDIEVEPSGTLLVLDGTLVVNNGSVSENRPWTFTVMRVDPATGDRTILSRP